MNEKKSKRLRQLVRHLMSKGTLTEAGWINYTPDVYTTTLPIKQKVSKKINPEGFVTEHASMLASHGKSFITGPVRLDAACGKAIYRSMKKRADIQHRQ